MSQPRGIDDVVRQAAASSGFAGWGGNLDGDTVWLCSSYTDAFVLNELGIPAAFGLDCEWPDEPLPRDSRYWAIVPHHRDEYAAADAFAARRRAAGYNVQVRDWSEYLDAADVTGRSRYGLVRLLDDVGEERTKELIFDLGVRATDELDEEVTKDIARERELAAARKLADSIADAVHEDVGRPFQEDALEAAAMLQTHDPAAFARLQAAIKDSPANLNDFKSLVKERRKFRVAQIRERKQRAGIRNYSVAYEVADDGRSKTVYRHVELTTIVERVHKATGFWPRLVRGQLFVPGRDYGVFNGESPVDYLPAVTDLSAWLQTTCDVSWRDGQVYKDGDQVRSVNYGELAAALAQQSTGRYDQIETLPHHPPSARIHYTCEVTPGDGTTLDAFVDLFNPDTPADRQLIQAMLVTPGWGGGFGRRPAFIVMSDHGRGVGKTSTVEAVAKVWGGFFNLRKDEDWGQFVARLLTPGQAKRVIFIDNLKGRMDSQALESTITLPTISGKQMYTGEATIPNSFTWCISANTPELSTDLADRAVPIKIGPRRHDVAFIEEVEDFLESHHEALVGDVLAFLQSDAVVELESTTRFQSWERAILARFENGNELVELIRSRRGGVDVEADEAADALAVVHDLLEKGGFDEPSDAHTIIPTGALVDAFRTHWMESRLSSRRFWSRFKPLLVQPSFAGQASKYDGGHYGRGLRWEGRNAVDSTICAWNPEEQGRYPF